MSIYRENELKKAREKLFDAFESLNNLAMDDEIKTLCYVIQSIDRYLEIERKENDNAETTTMG